MNSDAPPAPEDDFFRKDKPRTSLLLSIPPRIARADRWTKVVAAAFLGFAVAVLGFMLFVDTSPKTKLVEKVVEKVVEREKIVYRDRAVETVRTDSAEATTAPSERADPRLPRAAKAKDTSRPETPEERKKRLLAELSATNTSGGGERAGGSTAAAASPSGPGLSDRELSSVVGKNASSLQTCYEQSMKRGETPDDRDVKVLVDLNVGGSGMVKRAAVSGPGAKYPGLKSCIESAAKKWIFPAKSGESAAQFPFLFTPK